MAERMQEGRIEDENSFRQWLEMREHGNLIEYGPVMAHRASLRAIPSLSLAFRFLEPEKARGAVFWSVTANLIFRAWRRNPESNFSEALKFAHAGAYNAAESASSSNMRIVSACRAAASVAQIVSAELSQHIKDDVIAAVTFAASSLDNDKIFWGLVNIDAGQLQSGTSPLELMNKPLWQSEPPADAGIAMSQLRRLSVAASPDWAWLFDWYEAREKGSSRSWELTAINSVKIEQLIATGGFEPGFWRMTPDENVEHVAGWLREAKMESISSVARKTTERDNAAQRDREHASLSESPIGGPATKTAGNLESSGIPDFMKRAAGPDVSTSESAANDNPLLETEPPPEPGEASARPSEAGIQKPASKRADLEPLADTVDGSVDHLGRANIAYALAGRINEVWDQMNKPGNGAQGAAPGFVIHIDAPWGGGKSTFAEHIAQILNPYIIKGALPAWLKALPIGKDGTWPERFRRPWHIVRFNAWQHQHVTPPWWVFYETIRETVTRQGAEEINRQEAALPAPSSGFAFGSGVRRWFDAVVLGLREYAWRLFSPSFWFALLPLVLTVVAIYLLVKFGVIQTVQKDGKFEIGIPSNATGFIATTAGVILGGGAALWRLWAAFTQTLLPGTPDAAKNFSLGSGDPLKRMKAHFVSLMERVHRPVLVIVDDLDRCEPAFVVELVRGMQTILASPRVVYLLLGDRDWIEQSFTEVHKAMKGVEVGPEHRFGGRFVEKAIQFSMVLPDVSEAGRQDYVRQLLTTSGRTAAAEPVTAPPSVLDSAAVPESQKKIVEDLKADAKEVLETDDYQLRELKAKSLADKFDLVQIDLSREAFDQEMAQKLFFRAATDSTAEKATAHMIEGMASILPANPRQIKRIINTLSLLGQVLRIKDPAKRPGSADWQMLARWVVLMVEWPKSWFTLTRYPGIADVALAIAQGKSEDEIAAIETRVKGLGFLPATGARPLAKLIAANPTVMRALDFLESDWVHKPITGQDIEWLRVVMPAASGQVLQPPQQEKPASADAVPVAGKGA